MKLILETKRLILRPLKLSDAEAFFEMDKNPNVHQYLWNNPTEKIEDSIKQIETIRQQYIDNKIGRFAIVLKETNEFMGWAGIKFVTVPENGNVNFYDFGYRLNEKFWGKGYATEASYPWLEYGFNEMKINEMNAYAQVGNGASNAILQKIGLNLIEKYSDKDGVFWNWYALSSLQFANCRFQQQL